MGVVEKGIEIGAFDENINRVVGAACYERD